MDFLKIDGSFGEGGGQIVRTAVTLSSITHRPIQVENIRKNRKVTGLRSQHVTALELLSKICNAEVSGLKVGSSSLKFNPGEIQSYQLDSNVGTAGSISLILQVLIIPVSLAKKKLKLSLIGGTDVPWSPTMDYTRYVLAAAYSRAGINFELDVKKRGYYPKGNGKISLDVYPSRKIVPFSLHERTTDIANLFCTYSKYPTDEIQDIIEKIKQQLQDKGIKINSFVKREDALDRGGAILVYSQDSSSIIGVDSLVAKNVPDLADRFLNNTMGVDKNLADMLVVPASLSKDTSVYRTNEISTHLKTNLYVAAKITGCKYGIGKVKSGYEIRIKGNLDTCIQ